MQGEEHIPDKKQGDKGERFSRKVFVGGLPPDIDEGKLFVLQKNYTG
jgi:hypothetical protein